MAAEARIEVRLPGPARSRNEQQDEPDTDEDGGTMRHDSASFAAACRRHTRVRVAAIRPGFAGRQRFLETGASNLDCVTRVGSRNEWVPGGGGATSPRWVDDLREHERVTV